MTFNLQLARQCARFSSRAYREASIADAATSTEVLIGGLVDEPQNIIVAFRGSQEPRDFIYDFRFFFKDAWPSGDDEASVHHGFNAGYQAVSSEIIARVRFATRIICTGHSLGGARAILCAAHLADLGFPVSNVITFGCPRVGDAVFRDDYNEDLHDCTLRFEAQGDPVPWMPPLINGYRHVGREVYLKNNGSYAIDPALPAHIPAFVQTLLAEAQSPDAKFAMFFPHHIANYERLLANVKEAV